jgi:hypothetical protein
VCERGGGKFSENLKDRDKTHTHTHMCACTYIPWIHKCVIKTAGCGTSNKYTNIQICRVKHYKHFTKTV